MKRGPGNRWARLRKHTRVDTATPGTVGAKIIQHNFKRGRRHHRGRLTDRYVSRNDRPNTLQGTRRR